MTGTATLSGASIVPIRLGTAADMNAALAASPSGELRWLVLRAAGGLGGTKFVALSNTTEVDIAYPANGTDVELVVGGTSVDPEDPRSPVVIATQAPPVLQARDRILQQQAVSGAGTVFDLGADCHRAEGLGGALRSEQLCVVAQGRLLAGRLDAGSADNPVPSGLGGAGAFEPGRGTLDMTGADAAVGMIGRVGEEFWYGYVLGFGAGSFDSSGTGGAGPRTSYTALQIAALARWASRPLELRGMLGHIFRDVDARRTSALAGGGPRIDADHNQHHVSLVGEGRWWIGTRGSLAVAPTLRLHQAYHGRGGYTEQGDTADAFDAAPSHWTSLRMTAGLTGEVGMELAGRPVVIEPRLGWQQELSGRTPPVEGSYRGAPDVTLPGTGARAARDSVVAGLAAVTEIAPCTRMRLGYDGVFSGSDATHALTLRLSHAW